MPTDPAAVLASLAVVARCRRQPRRCAVATTGPLVCRPPGPLDAPERRHRLGLVGPPRWSRLGRRRPPSAPCSADPGAAVLGVVVVAAACRTAARRAVVAACVGTTSTTPGWSSCLAALARSLRSGAGAHVGPGRGRGPPCPGRWPTTSTRLLDRLDQGVTLGDGLRRWSDERAPSPRCGRPRPPWPWATRPAACGPTSSTGWPPPPASVSTPGPRPGAWPPRPGRRPWSGWRPLLFVVVGLVAGTRLEPLPPAHPRRAGVPGPRARPRRGRVRGHGPHGHGRRPMRQPCAAPGARSGRRLVLLALGRPAQPPGAAWPPDGRASTGGPAAPWRWAVCAAPVDRLALAVVVAVAGVGGRAPWAAVAARPAPHVGWW